MNNELREAGGIFKGYLTPEEVRRNCPVAYLDHPSNPKLSKHYVQANTSTIIEDLSKLGWQPVTATMRKSKGKSTIFTKHMIVFQNPDIIVKGENGDDSYPRIILTNSHDGFNSFRFRVGIFRLVCSNGLVIATEEFGDFRIKHKGYTFQELRVLVGESIEKLPQKVQVMNKMKQRILTFEEQVRLAMDALMIRSGITPGSEEASKIIYDEATAEDILTPLRKQDEGNDLWLTFNRIQEKVVKGGFQAALEGKKVRKVRPIKSFEKDLDINQRLFSRAVQYLEV